MSGMSHRRIRVLAAAVAVAIALPALSYVLPAPAVLRLAARKRAEAPPAAELRGTLSTGATAPVAAVLWLKGARCRLELVGAPDRPFAIVRSGRVATQRGLDRVPGALALAEGACAVLAPSSPEAFTQSLASRGIAVQEITFGRLAGRVAYVLGGRAADKRPLLWLDKQSLHPLQLAADLGGARRQVLLSEYPPAPVPPPGERVAPLAAPADFFPRVLEVHGRDGLETRFAVDKVAPNPRIADSLL